LTGGCRGTVGFGAVAGAGGESHFEVFGMEINGGCFEPPGGSCSGKGVGLGED
jgi:hypothetical protein